MPPFYKQVINFAQEMWMALKFRLSNKYIKVSPEIQRQRLQACMSCAFFRDNRCTKCGCFMKLKTHLASAECPEHKWHAASNAPLDDCGVCPP
jgi:hypothetical protein